MKNKTDDRVEQPEAAPLVVPVATLAPEPFELTKEFKVVVRPVNDSYVASFFDAGINASGETPQDAVANLKDIMVTLFRKLDALPASKLGKVPTRQLAVLKEFLRRKTPVCPT